MSFEIYVQCFTRGVPAGIPRAELRGLFPVEPNSEPDLWLVRYDELNTCHLGVTPLPGDPSLLQACCVLRPCGDTRLWDGLFQALRLGSLVLYFPGGGEPLVASTSVIEHLPDDLLEVLGTPRAVSSGAEIIEALNRA